MSASREQLYQKLHTMLSMQDGMNKKVHPDWIKQDFAWYRAAWIECGELMDHYGYKWWKKQAPDTEQVKLEIIDIWHFGMSALFTADKTWKQIANEIAEEVNRFEPDDLDVREATEALAAACLNSRQFSVTAFWQLMHAADLDFETLYQAYIGKNVLNFFRQDNGYKEGTYQKQWQGREDNEHLSEIVAALDSNSADFRDQVYQELASRYQSLERYA